MNGRALYESLLQARSTNSSCNHHHASCIRYRTPDSYGTGNRILFALRNVLQRRSVCVVNHCCQRVLLTLVVVKNRRFCSLFAKLRKERGQPFLNGQLDLWSSGLAKDAFGGFTASLLLEEDFEEEVDTATLSEAELKDYVRQEVKPLVSVMKLIMKSILLDFSSFPFKVVFFLLSFLTRLLMDITTPCRLHCRRPPSRTRRSTSNHGCARFLRSLVSSWPTSTSWCVPVSRLHCAALRRVPVK